MPPKGINNKLLIHDLLVTCMRTKNIAPDIIFLTFKEVYPSEKACIDKLIEIRERHYGGLCNNCESKKPVTFLWKKGKTRCQGCRKETAFTAGTVFHHSKVPLYCWFKLIWLWSTSLEHANATRLERDLRIPHATVYGSLQKLRLAISLSKTKLHGHIQSDILYTYKDRLVNFIHPVAGSKRAILISVQGRSNGAGQVTMLAMEDFDLSAFTEFRNDSFMMGYKEKQGIALGRRLHPETNLLELTSHFNYKFSNLRSVDVVAEKLNNWLWNNFHGAVIPSRFMQEYLDEFCFRWNHRYDEKGKKNKAYLFEQVLEKAVCDMNIIKEESGGKEVEMPRESHSIPEKVG